jgi:hypothetical protein
VDVTWNREQILPAEFTTSNHTGRTRFSIDGVHTGADRNILQPPAWRFPAYRMVDLADWLEQR